MDHKRIQKARKRANLTQAQLAEILGVNRATISKYENGEITPPVEQLELMAKTFGITLGTLLEAETVIVPGRLKIIEIDDPTSTHIAYRIEAADEEAFAIGMQIFGEAGVGPEYLVQERLRKAFDKLNVEGQVKAIERVEELTEIPKYQK